MAFANKLFAKIEEQAADCMLFCVNIGLEKHSSYA